MVNLFFLKTFIDAAKTGSVREAALKNYVTQPAVTQQIRILEQKLGIQLFSRQNKKMTLTAAGKIFFKYAENILGQYEEAKMRLSEVNENHVGTIRIATIYSIGLYELQAIIRQYLRKYPKVDIRLEYHPFDKIYEMVAGHQVDFGFVSFPNERRGVISKVFTKEKLVLAQSRHHRVLSKKKTSIESLNGIRFVAFETQTPSRLAIDGFLNSHSVRPVIVNEYDNVETLKSAVQLGIGCSIVPLITIERELKEGTLETIPMKSLTLKRPLGILCLKKAVDSKSLHEFYEAVLNHRH
ncbi:MAG: hypothetical protein AUJ71_01640 [Candidatus Omnitrophica bacterium CG1_02_49_16]|nr:MAG: hypothetical protein AUJ71_01640 [Candidatus Omnitrophica bacterium CG1_02_49_16]